jgi:hypothetical protein
MSDEEPMVDRNSESGWMTIRDADLYERVLHRLALRANGARLKVVEWGAGRSTLSYTRYLDEWRIPFTWLSIDHDWNYFQSEIAPDVSKRPNARILKGEELVSDSAKRILDAEGLLAISFEVGALWPSLEGHESDRSADLDRYVSLPSELGFQYDFAVVDGRKRRRCLLEASRTLTQDGLVLLHDAWRRHYQCAWLAFLSGRRFGDEWWIGSQADTDFSHVLPSDAFENPVQGRLE